jgi:tetratricopeptide (TPR) repeat protein
MTTHKDIYISFAFLLTIVCACSQEVPLKNVSNNNRYTVFYPSQRDSVEKYAKTKAVYIDKNPNDTAFKLNDTGLVLYNQHKFDAAVLYYSKSIAVRPYSHVYDNRANARLIQQDTAGAFEDYNLAIRIDTLNPSPYFNRANLLTAQKKYLMALADYNHALLAKSKTDRYILKTSDIFINRGNLLFYLNDYGSALKDYSEALKTDSKNLMAYANRADIKYRQGDFNGAIEDYSHAISINPDAELYFNRASNYLNMDKYTEAIDDLNQVITANSTFYDGYYMRSQAYGRSGKFAEAIKDLDKMVQLQPKNPLGFYLRGYTYVVFLQNREKGCPDLQQAKQMGDTSADSLIIEYCK